MSTRVSLPELTAAGARLRPGDAVAIVSEICRQHDRGLVRGMPSAHVVRLTEEGAVLVEGPVNTDRPPVAAAAALLDELLEGSEAPPEYRAPGALRLVVARGLGTLDLPPFVSVQAFCSAISRFAAPDLGEVVRRLFADAGANLDRGPLIEVTPPAPVPIERPSREALTISDVRRARRATGLSLHEISIRSHVPVNLLRELEWGYLRNWPDGLYGRSQLVRYARAAGLDEALVVSVAWPLLEEAIGQRGPGAFAPVPAELAGDTVVAADPAADAEIIDVQVTPVPVERHRSIAWWLAPIAASAILGATLAPAIWPRAQHVLSSTDRASSAEVADVSRTGSPVDRREPASTPPSTDRRDAPSSQGTTSAVAAPAATDTEAARVVEGPRPVDATTAQVRSTSTADSGEGAPTEVVDPVAYSPAFSNNGTAMFFHEENRDGTALVRADTSRNGEILKITRIVDDSAQNFHVRPSPDGSSIAFDSDREGTRGVFVADADGRNVHRVSGDGFAAVPSWSPDGSQIAFVKGEADNPRVWNLWKTDLKTGELQRLTSYKYGQPWGGSWFADGTRIAYSHETELVVMNLETGARRVYQSPIKGRLVRTPAVSPDGRRIIFQVYHDGAWLLDLRTGNMRRVLDDPTAEEYTWSPDGHRVAFHSHKAGGWGVWVMGQ